MKKNICIFLLCLFAVIVSAQNKEFDSISKKIDQNSGFWYHKTKTLIDELYQIAYTSPDSLRLLAECIAKEVKLYADHSIVDTSFKKKINDYLFLLDSIGEKREVTILKYSLGLYNYGVGDYGEVFINALQALERAKQLKDSVYIAKSFGLLGSVCNNINQPYLSHQYFTEQLAYVEKNSLEHFRAQQNCYIKLAKDRQYDDFIDSMKHLIAKAEITLPDYQTITLYLNLANAFLTLDSLDMAYDYLQKSRELMKLIDNMNLKAGLYSHLAKYSAKTKNYQEALGYYRRAYQSNRYDDRGNHLRSIYYGLASCFEILNEKDSTIFYLKRYRGATLQEERQNKAVKVYQQYISNYLELTENQLALAEQAALLQKRRNIIIVTLSTFIFAALALIILLINQQRRRKKAEANLHRAEAERQKMEAEHQKAEAERQKAEVERQRAEANTLREKAKAAEQKRYYQKRIDKIEKERQQEVIDAKERELASSALLISNKNEMLKRIVKLTERLRSEEGNAAHLSEEIDEIIHHEFQMDNAWKNFTLHFEQVHPDFFATLKKRAPHLTQENLRLCAYIKMGLSHKTIATLCGITSQSVANTRSRIKKQLGLLGDDDLEAFLKEIDKG